MSRDERIRHETRHDTAGQVVGADVVARFDVSDVAILADGIEVRLDFEQWRDVASAVHRECSAAAFEQPVEVILARVREALASGVVRAAEPGRNYSTRRAAAATLHRLADMVLAGTVTKFDVEWPFDGNEASVHVVYQVKPPSLPERIELKVGEGVVRSERGER